MYLYTRISYNNIFKLRVGKKCSKHQPHGTAEFMIKNLSLKRPLRKGEDSSLVLEPVTRNAHRVGRKTGRKKITHVPENIKRIV